MQLWEQNQSQQFDIVLTDVQMPEMHGLQATAYIRETEKQLGRHIPILPELESLGRSGDPAAAEELVRLLEEQVGEFNRVLARSTESVQQPH